MDMYLGTSKKQKPSPKPKVIDARYRIYYSLSTDTLYVFRVTGFALRQLEKLKPYGWSFIGFL